MDLRKDQTYTSIGGGKLGMIVNKLKEECCFQEWKWKYFAAIVGFWRMIANKMEGSQEICFL